MPTSCVFMIYHKSTKIFLLVSKNIEIPKKIT